jgi:hypothetical protein
VSRVTLPSFGVSEYDREALTVRWPWPTRGCNGREKKILTHPMSWQTMNVAAQNYVGLRYSTTNFSQFPGSLIVIPGKLPPPSLSAPCSRSYQEHYLLSNVRGKRERLITHL